MDRRDYDVFSEGTIGTMRLKNRIVRSATFDAHDKNETSKCGSGTLEAYATLAKGGVGLIIAGDIGATQFGGIDRIERLADTVHATDGKCAIVAQLSVWSAAMPSNVPTPFHVGPIEVISNSEIAEVVREFVAAIARVKEAGFDGVQIHAAHGHALLSYFLSPHTNRRTDEYGGSTQNRTRIIREIVEGARNQVGDFPILAKINCNDNVEGGIDIDSFPELAQWIVEAGVDAIEISGGMTHCLVRAESELGFPPRLCPEAHTRIGSVAKQSYFLEHAEAIDVDVPVILVGGNRNIERMEQAIKSGSIDFFALCRPLINEPDLPNRWLRGEGAQTTGCISCSTCLYPISMDKTRATTYCVYREDEDLYKEAVRWLKEWIPNQLVESNGRDD